MLCLCLQFGEISLPAGLLVLRRRALRVFRLVHSPSNDKHVTPARDRRLRVIVLLAKPIASLLQLYSRRHVDKTPVLAFLRPRVWVHADEADHEVRVLVRNSHCLLSVRALGHSPRRAHLCQEQKALVLPESDLLEPVHDAGPWNDVGVNNVRPLGDLVYSARVLADDRVADVREFPVLEDQKVVLLREVCQRLRDPVVPNVENVDVRLQAADVRANLVDQGQHFLGGVHVHCHGEIALFCDHGVVQALQCLVFRESGLLLVGQPLRSSLGFHLWLHDLVRRNEVMHAFHHLVGELPVLGQNAQDLRYGQRRVEVQAVGLQVLLPALLSIDEDDHVRAHQLHGVERVQGLQNRHPARHKIIHHEASLAWLEVPLNGFLRAVFLHLLPPHQHLQAVVECHGRGNGKRRVGDSAGHVKLGVSLHRLPHGLGHLAQHVRVRHDHAEIKVDGRKYAALQLEVTKLHGLDLVQLQHERLHLVLVRQAKPPVTHSSRKRHSLSPPPRPLSTPDNTSFGSLPSPLLFSLGRNLPRPRAATSPRGSNSHTSSSVCFTSSPQPPRPWHAHSATPTATASDLIPPSLSLSLSLCVAASASTLSS
mmetsp:Transcript_14502/g.41306  ORF Transcript_14502/g.41306 Transcript_14502/m.41306 type:complete len:594 (+) Transcript_14502:1115-2896(+)